MVIADENEDKKGNNGHAGTMAVHSFDAMPLIDDGNSIVGNNAVQQPWRQGRTESTDISYLLYSFGLELNPAVAHEDAVAKALASWKPQ